MCLLMLWLIALLSLGLGVELGQVESTLAASFITQGKFNKAEIGSADAPAVVWYKQHRLLQKKNANELEHMADGPQQVQGTHACSVCR